MLDLCDFCHVSCYVLQERRVHDVTQAHDMTQAHDVTTQEYIKCHTLLQYWALLSCACHVYPVVYINISVNLNEI